nr:reverse transcriptase domain-containing protein [Tanacetum cinerariifolium]
MPVTRQEENDALTPESIQAMIDRAIQRNSTHTQDDASQNSGGGPRRPVQPAHVCSYTDFIKCQPFNFKGTKSVVGLSHWVEKMKSIFHISGCAVENQVMFATCTMFDAALTWWNGHVRTLGHDAAYAMTGRLQEEIDGQILSKRKKKPYGGSKPLCPKCNYHHDGDCAPKCTNCKKVSHLTKDCWHPINANNQRAITCYECGNQGHYRSDYPVLKNQGTEARGIVYALGGGETNHDFDNTEEDINA